MKKLLVLALSALVSLSALASIKAVTENGEVVILNHDGT